MKKIYTLLVALLLLVSVSNAATKTWAGGTGAALNWTTGANWLPVGAPAAGDDVVFNTAGTLTFTTGPGANFAFNSLTISAGTVTLIGTGATRTFTLGGNAGDDFVVSNSATLVISSSLTITMAANATALIDGTLTVNAGRTFNTDGAGVVSTVNGTINNSGTVICTTASKLLMQSGSTYTHTQSGGNIPTATWNSASTCAITGVIATMPTNDGQTFGNFTWNCAGQGTNQVSFNTTLNATGTVTITNTGTVGTGRLQLGNATGNSIANLDINGGTLRIGSGTARTLDVTGNVSISSGTLLMSSGAQIGTLNVAGNFSFTGGTIDETSTGSGAINFNGSSAQTFTSGGTVSNTINWTVNNGATLNMAAAATTVTGNSFTVSSGGTLGITSTAGIVTAPTASGNIQTTSRTFNAGGNYNYIGSGGAQVTGNALPATINSLTVNNSSGVSVSNAVTLNSATAPLTLTNGIVTGATITVSAAYTGAGGGGSAASHINGPLAKTGSTAYEFPVGNGTLYRPVSVSSLSGSATVTAQYFQANPKTTFGTALGAGVDHIGVCEYWTLDDGAATITGLVGLKFGTSCNGNGYVNDPATLLVAHWTGTQWASQGNDGTATSTSVKANIASSFSPFTIGSSSILNPLPVKIGSIKAYEKLNGVQIDWTAFTEINVEKYVIERSADGVRFSSIGEVFALNNGNESRYGFFDPAPLSGLNFYRLRNLDNDGKSAYSNIVRIDLRKGNADVNVYPNPVRSSGYLSYNVSVLGKGAISVRIFNASGQEVYVQKFSHAGGAINQTIQLPAAMKAGLYTLQLDNDGVKVAGKTFMIQ